MREIKFRAWDHFNKKMVTMADNLELINGSYDLFYADIFTFTDDNTRHPLMQYTGYTDRNGVEIYEGDILKNSEIFSGLEVVRDIRDAKLTNSGLYDSVTYSPLGEVVGNIYENPELVGGTGD